MKIAKIDLRKRANMNRPKTTTTKKWITNQKTTHKVNKRGGGLRMFNGEFY